MTSVQHSIFALVQTGFAVCLGFLLFFALRWIASLIWEPFRLGREIIRMESEYLALGGFSYRLPEPTNTVPNPMGWTDQPPDLTGKR